ncbi:MAG: hypothetical protein WA188_14965 [Terriglobales bacterium]
MALTDSPVGWMRAFVGDWLGVQEWKVSQLLSFLRGYGLPPVGHDEKPYLWLLRGLSLGSDRYQYEKEMAKRVAILLDTTSVIEKMLGRRNEKASYNLLLLAAGLSCPDELAGPLYRLFQFIAPREEFRRKKWLGIPLVDCLRTALIENQKDSQLGGEWREMLSSGTSKHLAGNPYDGFDGIRLMPSSPRSRGEPALNEIGSALRHMTRYLNDERERRGKFRDLVVKLLDTYPGRRTWHRDLIVQADVNEWPSWAIDCLRLFVPLTERSDPPRSYYVWEVVFDIARDLGWITDSDKLCGGQVYRVQLQPDGVQIVEEIALKLEQSRIDNPYSSARSVVGGINQALCEAELSLKDSLPEVASAVVAARRKRICAYQVCA